MGNLFECNSGGFLKLIRTYIGDYVNNGLGSKTETYDCSGIKNHNKLTVNNFTIVSGISGSGSFTGAGNYDLAGSGSGIITDVSYSDPILTVTGNATRNGGHDASFNGYIKVPIYCISAE